MTTCLQRLYLMQLSSSTIPLPSGKMQPMVCVSYLVETDDGKHILIDSGIPTDYQLPSGATFSENEKKRDRASRRAWPAS